MNWGELKRGDLVIINAARYHDQEIQSARYCVVHNDLSHGMMRVEVNTGERQKFHFEYDEMAEWCSMLPNFFSEEEVQKYWDNGGTHHDL